MRADSGMLSTIDAPRFGGIAIIADEPIDRTRLERLLRPRGVDVGIVVFRGALADFVARPGADGADLALLHLAHRPDAAQIADIESLTRRLKVILTGDQAAFDALRGLRAARAWAFLSEEELTSGVLEEAIRNLACARASEDRLLRRLGDQRDQVRCLAGAAALVGPAVERSKEAIWRLVGLAAAGATQAGEAAVEAFEIADEIEMLNEELIEHLQAPQSSGFAPQTTDLNGIVENFGRECLARGAQGISLQTGSDPISIKPAAAALRGLLDTLLTVWRGARQADDRLELLTWDAGHDARLAVVLTKSRASERATAPETGVSAMRSLFASLRPMVVAVGGAIESDWAPANYPEFEAMTICLPKRAPLRAFDRRPRVVAGASDALLGVKGLAG